jgi:hypothetical protein
MSEDVVDEDTEYPQLEHGRGKRPIDYRDPRLVIALIGTLYEATEAIPERELVDTFAGERWKTATVKRTVRELVDFGAIRRIQPRPGRQRIDPIRVRLSTLGRAWTDRRLERYVGDRRDDDLEPDDGDFADVYVVEHDEPVARIIDHDAKEAHE